MSFTMSESEINDLHKHEFAEAASGYGGVLSIPWTIITELSERTRQRWVRWVAEREGGAKDGGARHDKTKRLDAFVTGLARTGVEVTINADMLMGAAECSRGTATKYISDNRSRFVQVGRGQYRVVDTDAERAAARKPATAATLPLAAHKPSSTASTAQAEMDIVADVMSAVTGTRRGAPA